MGVQPALSYNFGAGLYKRMDAILKRTAIATIIIGSLLTALVFIFRVQMVSFFLDNNEVVNLAQYMVSLTMVTGPIFGISQLCITFLQSTDKASMSTLASLLRQGIFLLPLTFILNAVFGLNGLLWSPVISDVLSTVFGLLFFIRHHKKISAM